MDLFDRTEYERWLAACDDELAAARHNATGGFHHVAVLHAEQAAQCALKGLLHGVGAGAQARGHGLASLAERCAHAAGLALNDAAREALADLAREYLPARYPDALPEGTPAQHYGAGSASRALTTAEQVRDLVQATWQRLHEEAADDEPT